MFTPGYVYLFQFTTYSITSRARFVKYGSQGEMARRSTRSAPKITILSVNNSIKARVYTQYNSQ